MTFSDGDERSLAWRLEMGSNSRRKEQTIQTVADV